MIPLSSIDLIMRRLSASRNGQMERTDWMSHSPLMRESKNPSCGLIYFLRQTISLNEDLGYSFRRKRMVKLCDEPLFGQL